MSKLDFSWERNYLNAAIFSVALYGDVDAAKSREELSREFRVVMLQATGEDQMDKKKWETRMCCIGSTKEESYWTLFSRENATKTDRFWAEEKLHDTFEEKIEGVSEGNGWKNNAANWQHLRDEELSETEEPNTRKRTVERLVWKINIVKKLENRDSGKQQIDDIL